MTKVIVWANADMDGAASVILLKQCFKDLEYRSVQFFDFSKVFSEWLEDNVDDYDKIFVVGFSFDQRFATKIDYSNVIIVADHLYPLNLHDAIVIRGDVGSCCKLLYQKFSKKISFSKPVEALISLANDYNTQNRRFEQSSILNAIYRDGGSDRFRKFVEKFHDGWSSFTKDDIEIFNKFKVRLEQAVRDMDLYKGRYEDVEVLATVSTFSVNEISSVIFDSHDTDVVIVFNPSVKYVSFRARKGSNVDVSRIATDLCDGGGHPASAGGKPTGKFMAFTQTLKPL